MSITFKFKSTKEFETLDIERKPYISIGEVRSRIMNVKKLDKVFRKDFDLVLYDAVTGQGSLFFIFVMCVCFLWCFNYVFCGW